MSNKNEVKQSVQRIINKLKKVYKIKHLVNFFVSLRLKQFVSELKHLFIPWFFFHFHSITIAITIAFRRISIVQQQTHIG
jgi:hypothetical protein